MSENDDQDPGAILLGGLVLIVVGLGAVAVIGLVIKAIVELIVNLVQWLVLTAIKLTAISIGFALLLVLLALLGDLLASLAIAFARWRRYRRSVLGSSFPYHEHLRDPRTLSGYFFTKIDFYLGDRSARVRARRRPFWIQDDEAFRRWQNEKIDGFRQLRNALLTDPAAFRTFWLSHAFRILRCRQTDFVLVNICNALWKRFQDEAQSPNEVTRLSQVICCKIASQPTRRGAKFTKAMLTLVSFGHIRFNADQTALTAANRRERIEHYLYSSAAFHDLMDKHLFEILGECRGLRNLFDCSAESAEVHQRQENAQHYKRLVLPVRVKRLPTMLVEAPPKRESTSSTAVTRRVFSAGETELPIGETEEEIAQFEQTARARARELQLQARRRKYLTDMTPELLWQHFKEAGECQFTEQIHDVLLEQAGSRAGAEEAFQRLFFRSAFIPFWLKHESAILEMYEERLLCTKQKAEANARQERDKSERTARIETHVHAVCRLRDECRKAVEAGHAIQADDTYGYLMAVSFSLLDELHASGEIPFPDATEIFEREIRRLLEDSAAEAMYFSEQAKAAVQACNTFRSGTLPYGDLVEESGVQKDGDLWTSVLTFYKCNEAWRCRHDARQKNPSSTTQGDVLDTASASPSPAITSEPNKRRSKRPTPQIGVASQENESDYFSVQEAARHLNLSDEATRRLLQHEPGVLIYSNPRRGRRAYRTLRIPKDVFERVKQRMTVVAP